MMKGPFLTLGVTKGPFLTSSAMKGPFLTLGATKHRRSRRRPRSGPASNPEQKPNANHPERSRAQPTPMACLPSRRPGEARSHRVKGPARSTPCTKTGPLTRCDSPEGGRREGRHTHPCQISNCPTRCPLGDLPVRRGPPGGKPTTGKSNKAEAHPTASGPRNPAYRPPPTKPAELSTARQRHGPPPNTAQTHAQPNQSTTPHPHPRAESSTRRAPCVNGSCGACQ